MTRFRLGLLSGFGLILFIAAPTRADDLIFTPQGRVADIDYQLKSIVVTIDFTNASIEDATLALTEMSKQLDPNHKGVQFVIQPLAAAQGKPITLKLDRVPLGETIRYMCDLGRVHYKIGDRFISITPFSEAANILIKRTFHVEPSFVEAASGAGLIPSNAP